MTRPRGRPPTPSARSRPTEPVGTTAISATSPPASGMMAPLPNCFSMAAMALATGFIFSLIVDMGLPFCLWSLVSIEQAVLQRLGEVRPAHGVAGVEVGERARDAPRARERARRQAEARHGRLEEAMAVGIERRDGAQLGRGEARVPPRPSRRLPCPRGA